MPFTKRERVNKSRDKVKVIQWNPNGMAKGKGPTYTMVCSSSNLINVRLSFGQTTKWHVGLGYFPLSQLCLHDRILSDRLVLPILAPLTLTVSTEIQCKLGKYYYDGCNWCFCNGSHTACTLRLCKLYISKDGVIRTEPFPPPDDYWE